MEEYVCWDEGEYRLDDFLRKRSLPQLVKVVIGYDGGDSDTCLDEGEIINIEEVLEAGSIVSKDENNQKLFIPRTCEQKVEVILQGATRSYYETVGELCEVFPTYVRVFPESSKKHKRSLCRSFKLTLIGITEKRKYLECQNQNGVKFCLPMSLPARFIPLEDGREYFVHEVVDSFKMPVMVQFINSKYENSFKDSALFNTSCGILTFLDVLKEDTIVYSTESQLSDELKTRNTFMIPKKAMKNIIVVGGKIAAANENDSMRFTKSLSENSDSVLDALESEGDYTPLQCIGEYMHLLMPQNVENVHTGAVAPKLPLNTVQQSEVASLTAFNVSTETDICECEARTSNSTKHPDECCFENGHTSKSKCASRNDGEYINLLDHMSAQNVGDRPIPPQKPSPKDSPKTHNAQHGSEYINIFLPNVQSVYTKPKGVAPKPPPKPHGIKCQNSSTLTAVRGETKEVNKVTKVCNLDDSSSKSLVTPLEENLCSKVETEEIKEKLASKNLKTMLPNQQNYADISSLSVENVVELLTRNHLDQFADAFRSNMVDGKLLMELDRDCLHSLGLNNFQVTKLHMLIKGWLPKTK